MEVFFGGGDDEEEDDEFDDLDGDDDEQGEDLLPGLLGTHTPSPGLITGIANAPPL